MAGAGVVVRGEPVVITVVTRLRVIRVVELRFCQEMPFANVARFVTRAFEKLGIRDLARAQVSGVIAREVTPNAVAVRGAAGEDGGAGRRADTAGRVALIEFHALGGQLVEVRRLNERMAVGARISPAHVVRENDDNVWRFVGASFNESAYYELQS